MPPLGSHLLHKLHFGICDDEILSMLGSTFKFYLLFRNFRYLEKTWICPLRWSTIHSAILYIQTFVFGAVFSKRVAAEVTVFISTSVC